MKIMIQSSSMVPIYEQIVEQIKALILNGTLKENDALPSVRSLSKDLRISALTVKKAYDFLEEEGLTVTVHGKGTYVAHPDSSRLLKEYQKEIEETLETAFRKGKQYGLSREELTEMAELILDDVF